MTGVARPCYGRSLFFEPLSPRRRPPCFASAPMTDSTPPAYSLAWRIAVAAVLLRLIYTVLVQAYTLMTPLPYGDQIRGSYMQPAVLAPLLANLMSTLLIVGVAAWCATRQWLARHGAATVSQPGRMLATFLALQALYTVCLSSGVGIAQNELMIGMLRGGSWLEEAFGLGIVGRSIAINMMIRAVTIVLEVIGIWVALRVAAWTSGSAGPAAGVTLKRRHVAWICGLTVLIWQTSVSIMLGGFLQMQTLEAGWAEYALGYWVFPVVLLALVTLVCLKVLPRPLERPGIGRAVALGSLAFWFAQVLGLGLGFVVLKSMTWEQLAWAAQSPGAAALVLLAYGALLSLGCLVGARMLHRNDGESAR